MGLSAFLRQDMYELATSEDLASSTTTFTMQKQKSKFIPMHSIETIIIASLVLHA